MHYAEFFKLLATRLTIEEDVLTSIIQQKMMAQDIAVVTDSDGTQWVTQPFLSDGECRIMEDVQQLLDVSPLVSIAPDKAVDWLMTQSDTHYRLTKCPHWKVFYRIVYPFYLVGQEPVKQPY